MADIAVTKVTRTSTPIAAGTALSDSNNTFDNDGVTFVKLVAVTETITVDIVGQTNQPLDDVATTITATVEAAPDGEIWGPFPTTYYNTLAGKCQLNVTSGTASNLSVNVFSVRDDFN